MTIAQIEDAIITRLEAQNLQVGEIKIQKGTEGYLRPTVSVATEEGKFTRITDVTYNQTLNIHVYVVFKNFKNEAERRKGLYPILEGIIGILALQKLGLAIEALKPVRFGNVTTEEMDGLGLLAYEIVFETGYNITKMDEEQAVDLLKVGLDYYLKPGDDASDASDIVTL